ncbi:MAG TPA: VWA domain-containing protein [Pyrinomonadaceae bacterium]|nr:VWA domain-containing protein [Pyrinomonadaceae bacterium]
MANLLYRSLVVVAMLTFVSLSQVSAQQNKPQTSPSPSPTPTPAPSDQEAVRVFTEEVRLPVIAFDAFGHYDPTLEINDVLVIEDGVIQQVRSIRHIPANVLFLLDTGGELSGLGGMSKSTWLTREVAANLIDKLPQGSWFEILQSGNSADVVQRWTTDKAAAFKVLKNKLNATKRSRISEAIVKATQELKDRPEGSRHVVMITDGVDSPGAKIDRSVAIKKLVAARATVHVISYTEFVRQKSDKKTTELLTGQLPTSSDPITRTDPTLPPGTTRSPAYGVGIRFDPAMRRQRKAYESEVKKSQPVLASLADETGGKLLLPISSDEMLTQSNEIARAIGAEYVVTYRPKRPLADARPGEYRRIQVQSRKVGVTLHSRRGYVVPTAGNE